MTANKKWAACLLLSPKRRLVQCKDMSEVEVKADSKANAEFGRD
jgi:hypothetical protein